MDDDATDSALRSMIAEGEETLARVGELSAHLREQRRGACGRHFESLQEVAGRQGFPAELRAALDAETEVVYRERQEGTQRRAAERRSAARARRRPRPGMTRI